MNSMRDPMLVASEIITDAERRRGLAVFCVFGFFNALSGQAYMATQPLLITEALKQEVIISGVVQAVMIAGALISFLLLNPLLRRFPPHKIVIFAQFLRIGSSTVYAVCVSLVEIGPWTLPIVMASRFVFGLSMGAAATAVIWISHRFQEKERPRAIAKVSASQSCGLVLGPVFGSLLSMSSPSLLDESAAPAWASLAVSVLLGTMMAKKFPDKRVLPYLKKGDDLERASELKGSSLCTCIILMSITCAVLLGAMALEGTAPIIVKAYALPVACPEPGAVTSASSLLVPHPAPSRLVSTRPVLHEPVLERDVAVSRSLKYESCFPPLRHKVLLTVQMSSSVLIRAPHLDFWFTMPRCNASRSPAPSSSLPFHAGSPLLQLLHVVRMAGMRMNSTNSSFRLGLPTSLWQRP